MNSNCQDLEIGSPPPGGGFTAEAVRDVFRSVISAAGNGTSTRVTMDGQPAAVIAPWRPESDPGWPPQGS